MTDQQITISHFTLAADCAIIIFVRHPEAGKVKTRLAATMGNEKALAIYTILLQHTYELVQGGNTPVYVYYAENVIENDLWQSGNMVKKQQCGNTLGERMSKAFNEVFALGHQKVIIIGSDCYELTPAILAAACTALHEKDAVIGPATDGGYYLLGLKKMIPAIFENIAWSTSTVKDDTVTILQQQHSTYALLPLLTDVDEEKDLPDAIKAQL